MRGSELFEISIGLNRSQLARRKKWSEVFMNTDLQPEVERIIQARDFSALRGRIEKWSPVELASLIVQLRTEDQVIVFRMLPRKIASTVFEYLNAPTQEALLKTMGHPCVRLLISLGHSFQE